MGENRPYVEQTRIEVKIYIFGIQLVLLDGESPAERRTRSESVITSMFTASSPQNLAKTNYEE